jgi:uncharacterized protein (TIGR03067 family)
MRPYTLLVVGIVALFGVGCGKSDKDAIQGTWSVVSMEEGGRASKPEETKDDQVTITADKFTVVQGKRKEKQEETYKLDPGAKPKTIDLTMTMKTMKFEKVAAEIGKGVEVKQGEKVKPPEEKVEVKTLKGIYSLEGDSLKICFNMPDKDRPTEFAAKDGQVLITLKRAK